MYIACWIIRATDTHSEFVILIAFPQQKLLQERASMLRYTYMVCLSYFRQFISDLTRWATTQVVSICPVATEARFRSWTSPCETFDVECNTRPCFYPSNSVLPYQLPFLQFSILIETCKRVEISHTRHYGFQLPSSFLALLLKVI